MVASCYGNWDKLQPDGPLGLYADFTFYLALQHSTITTVYVCESLKVPFLSFQKETNRTS